LRIDRNPDQTHLPQKDYDPVSKTFVERTTQAKPMEKFASHATVDEVFKKLTGKDSASSFKPYAVMLKKAGIIKKAEELKAFINEMKFQGRSVDDVRHALKERFNQQVVDKMTNVSEAAMRKRYPKLDWSDSAKALNEAKHQELSRLTEGLNGADKGKFAEKWYKEVYGVGADGQVKIPKAEMDRLGLDFEKGRVPDFVQGDKIKEIKAIKDKITPGSRDQKQFDDIIKVSENPGGIEVTLNDGTRRTVDKVSYVFTDPQGVKANSKWMVKQLQEHDKLSFEVFNKSGERMIIDNQNVGSWIKNLDGWL
jgi:hypothetical protein